MTMLQLKRSNSSELEATIATSNYYTHGHFKLNTIIVVAMTTRQQELIATLVN